MTWYDEAGTPDEGEFWWAVEHKGHPAFYLRALLAGDFAPGRAVAARHVCALEGKHPVKAVVCGTCGEVPNTDDLEVIERRTDKSGFLKMFRDKRARWPKPTDLNSCWLCGSVEMKFRERVTVDDNDECPEVVCKGCAKFLKLKKAKKPKKELESQEVDS